MIANAKLTAIVALAVLGAALAGVVIATDDSEAATEEVTSYTVSYVVGGMTYTDTVKVADAGAYTLKGIGADGINVALDAGKTFKGWVLTEDKDKTDAQVLAAGSTYPLKADISFTAKIDVTTYTVSFADADGTALTYSYSYTADGATKATTGKQTGTGTSDIKLPYGATITLPTIKADLERADGLVFLGWYSSEAKVLDADAKTVTVKGDIALTATYRTDAVLTFVVDGITTYSHAVTGIVLPDVPTKEGFEFVAWTVDGKAVEDLSAYVKAATADATLVASFEPQTYSVTFVANGETVLPVQTVKHGELATEPKTIPVKAGCDFAGWVLESVDAEGVTVQTPYDFSQGVVSDLTIVAAFTATPEPEKTGLDNPVILSAVIIAVLIVGFVLAVLVLKKDVIRSKMAARLADAPKEGDKKA